MDRAGKGISDKGGEIIGIPRQITYSEAQERHQQGVASDSAIKEGPGIPTPPAAGSGGASKFLPGSPASYIAPPMWSEQGPSTSNVAQISPRSGILSQTSLSELLLVNFGGGGGGSGVAEGGGGGSEKAREEEIEPQGDLGQAKEEEKEEKGGEESPGVGAAAAATSEGPGRRGQTQSPDQRDLEQGQGQIRDDTATITASSSLLN